MNKPQTLQQAIVYFADKDIAHQYLVDLRWSDGVVCPHCGGLENSYTTTRKVWRCKACKKQFSVKVGTIFEDSPIGLDKWLSAVWMIANAKNGISSLEIHRSDSFGKFDSLMKKLIKVPPKEIQKPKKKRKKKKP